MITVFTATYNRSYIIKKLYDSLLVQTNKNFEWLIVDDGSEDDTKKLINSFIEKNMIRIKYLYKQNGGKHTAINLGVKEASGKYFFIVDSDDTLTPDACEKVENELKNIHSDKYAGVCFRRGGAASIKKFPADRFTANSLELAYKYNCKGDKAEVFFTEILRKYPFPEPLRCNFVPEALVFNRIANDGLSFLCIDYPVYICDYLDDGLTINFKRNFKKNRIGFALYYRECLFNKKIPAYSKIVCLIRLIQIALYGI
jgi:glycosyltransferase involved in cell wall biosynthesis